jgi:hypothetical protein
MKKLFLAGIAALFLATETAHAETWDFNNYKRCTASVQSKLSEETDGWPSIELSGLGPRGGPSRSILDGPFPLTVGKDDTATIIFKRKHLAKLKAAVRFLEKCRSWVWDHNKGKAIYATPKEQKELDNED